MLAIGLLALGIFSRLIFHAPNFTPVIALALFGGAYLKKKQALVLPLALMVLSDVFLGLHNIVIFTWGSVVLCAVLGLRLREEKNPFKVALSGLVGAVLFFIVTNFGAWLVMYPQTWQGLVNCYAAAVPFFRGSLLGTLVYSAVLFGTYELAARPLRKTRFARVFLS